MALDFGDYAMPERLPRPARDASRDVHTDADGVQHWPGGAQQHPLG